MDKNTWHPEFVGSFPGECNYIEDFYESLYWEPIEHNGVLYYPPFAANEIATFSLQTNTFEKIKYKDDDMVIVGRAFLGAAACGSYIYFIPYEYPAIVRLDTTTKEITHHSDWLSSHKELTGNSQKIYFNRPHIVGTTLWLSILETNAIMEFDMESLRFTIHEVGNQNYRYGRPFFDGVHFWLPPRHNLKTPVVRWNPITGATKEFPEIQSDYDNKRFLPFISCGGYLWLLPIVGEHAYKINTTTNTVTIADEFESGSVKSEDGKTYAKFGVAQALGDSIYAFSSYNRVLIEYNCTKRNRKEEAITFFPKTAEQLSIFYKNIFLQNTKKMKTASDSYYYEGVNTQVNAYIAHLLEENNDKKTALYKRRKELARTLSKNADGTAGQEILKIIKKR